MFCFCTIFEWIKVKTKTLNRKVLLFWEYQVLKTGWCHRTRLRITTSNLTEKILQPYTLYIYRKHFLKLNTTIYRNWCEDVLHNLNGVIGNLNMVNIILAMIKELIQLIPVTILANQKTHYARYCSTELWAQRIRWILTI